MNLSISLAPLWGPIPGRVWIQLLDTGTGPRLLTSDLDEPRPGSSRSRIYAVPLQGGGPPVEVVDHFQLMPARERWDAALRPDGRVVAAFTVFTGGDYHVEIASPPAASMGAPVRPWVLPPTMAQRAPFQGARFVRGLEGRLVVSALQWGAQPVIFADLALTEGRDEGLSFRAVEWKCVDAIFLADRDGLALVYRAAPTVRPGTQYDLVQGEVGYLRVDPDLRPLAPPIQLFPAGTVDALDATPLADGIAVVAATQSGLGVVAVGHSAGRFEVRGRGEAPLAGKARSPTIVASGGKLLVAAIHDAVPMLGEVALGP